MNHSTSVLERRGSDPAISLQGVRKHYGTLRAVDGVDLAVQPGEMLGLIGHNGAGKSTLFKLMLGLERATAGDIAIHGAPVRGSGFRAARRRLGYLPENVVLYDNLSGRETLRFFARLKGAEDRQCDALLGDVGLSSAASRPVREYSKGMRQRLGFAQALLGDPAVLLLDEPITGLDPAAIRDFHATLDALRARGVTVVLTSHILAELQERVDRLAVLGSGKLLATGSVRALRQQADLPLMVIVHGEGGASPDAVLPRKLCLMQGVTVREAFPGLHIACPRASKMAVLAAVARAGARVRDIELREPSLEEVFFGLSRQAVEGVPS